MAGGAEMLLQGLVALVEITQGVVDDLPVYQVFGVEDGKAGGTLERRGRHVIVLARGPDTDIGIGIVGIDHGIGVSAVAIVGTPHLRHILR